MKKEYTYKGFRLSIQGKEEHEDVITGVKAHNSISKTSYYVADLKEDSLKLLKEFIFDEIKQYNSKIDYKNFGKHINIYDDSIIIVSSMKNYTGHEINTTTTLSITINDIDIAEKDLINILNI